MAGLPGNPALTKALLTVCRAVIAKDLSRTAPPTPGTAPRIIVDQEFHVAFFRLGMRRSEMMTAPFGSSPRARGRPRGGLASAALVMRMRQTDAGAAR